MKTVEASSSSTTKEHLDFQYVDFKVDREKWNRYKLEDESILKTKFVLINATIEKDLEETVREAEQKMKKTKKPIRLKIGLVIQTRNLLGIESPRRLRGDPDTKSYSAEELRRSIVKEDLDFDVLTERWNIYKLKNGITLKVKYAPKVVSRSSKFDSRGTPIYLVDSAADVKFELPKQIEKRLKTARILESKAVDIRK